MRTAQAAMRHTDPALTMNIYTDPQLLDVAGAMNALPSLPLDGDDRQRAKATGTHDGAESFLVPNLGPTPGNQGTQTATADTAGRIDGNGQTAVSGVNDGLTQSLSTTGKMEQRGLEPLTFALQRRRSPN